MKTISMFMPYLRSLISPPEKDLKTLAFALSGLKKKMRIVQETTDKIEAMFLLLKVISLLHDENDFSKEYKDITLALERKNYGQLTEKITALKALQKHFKDAGRNLEGHNRSKPYQTVTTEHFFLGGIFELEFLPVSHWLRNKAELEKQDSRFTGPSSGKVMTIWYCIHDFQAGGFVKLHTDGILKQIKVLET